MIIIVDYGMGNFGSIVNMVKKVGGNAVLSADEHDISNAEKLILPGVGSFDNGMNHLRDLGCIDALAARVLNDGAPILGICLGMQLFTRRSEEGTGPGLGWIDAEAVKAGCASAVAAGSFFVFHGRRRAVLVNFPSRQELEAAL